MIIEGNLFFLLDKNTTKIKVNAFFRKLRTASSLQFFSILFLGFYLFCGVLKYNR